MKEKNRMSNTIKKSSLFMIFTLAFTAALLSACSSSQVSPESVVAEYLSAMAVQDSDAMVALSTANWETSALIDADSLTNVSSTIKDLDCTTIQSDAETADVVCNGELVLTYNDEDRSIDLSAFTYHLLKVNNAWLIDARS
ncbi:MAG TPA: hypothetical protein DCK95_09680 [Anaerolineaceae bacterium]|nr:hypothetical protein [Anaerolineaceae bacterium]